MMPILRKWLWSLLILAAINFLWSYEVYLGLGAPATKDLVLSYQPTHADLSRQGWPFYRLIEPRNAFGALMLAESQASQFYPPSILARTLLDPDTGLFTLLCLHLFLAGLFTLILCRTLGLSFSSGLIAAVSYMGSSFLVSQLDTPPILYQSALLPAIIAGAAAHARTKRLYPLILAGIALGAQTLAGHFQVGFYTIVYLIAWLLFFCPSGSGWRRFGSASAAIAIVLIIGLGISWVQLRSTLGFLPEAERSSMAESFWLSWAPFQIITLFQPFAFGISKQTFLGGAVPAHLQTYFGPGVYWMNVWYVGLVCLMLALLSLRLRNVRSVSFLWITLLTGLVLASGKYFPLNEMIYKLPLLNNFRFPARILVIATLGLAILSGFGLEAIRQEQRRKEWGAIFKAVSTAMVAAYAALTAFWLILLNRSLGPVAGFLQRIGFNDEKIALALQSFHPLNIDNIKTLSLSIVVIASLLAYLSKKLSAKTCIWLLAILCAADMTYFVRRHNLYVDPSFYRRALIENQAVAAALSGTRYFSIARYHSDPVDKQLDLLPPSLNLRTSAAGVGFRGSLFDDRFWRYQEALRRRYLGDNGVIDNEPIALDLFKLASVGIFLRREPLGQPGTEQIPLEYPAKIYRIRNTLPRVRWVSSAKSVQDSEQAWKFITRKDQDRVKTIVVEGAEKSNGSQTSRGRGFVSVLASRPGYLKMKVVSRDPGYITIADAWHKGWRAFYNSAESRVLRANFLFMAVEVPAGRGILELKYHEPCLGEGLVFLGLTVALMIGLRRLDKTRGKGVQRFRRTAPIIWSGEADENVCQSRRDTLTYH